MSQIDDWQEVIGKSQRAVWPKAAKAAVACQGMLVGGTAVAVHLRHRISEDIDILAPHPLDAASVRSLLESQAEESFTMVGLSRHEVHALVDGVSVHVFEDPNADSRTADVVNLQEGPRIDDMQVASLQDLLALKLDLVRWRSTLRDLIDLAAIDQLSEHSLEDGLAYWLQKFSAEWDNAALDQLVFKLRFPSAQDADPLFDDSHDQVIAYLKNRAPQHASRAWLPTCANRPLGDRPAGAEELADQFS